MSVNIWTDGSCFGNPGPGAWAVVVRYASGKFESFCGFLPHTTNNRAELVAIREAFKAVDRQHPLIIFSDSEWCVNILNRVWRARENLDLIGDVRECAKGRSVRFYWIPREANFADSLAREMMQTGRLEYNTNASCLSQLLAK